MGLRFPPARVTAIYPESSLHFEIAADTSLQQLCTLLTEIGKGHGDLLLVEVKHVRALGNKENYQDGND